MHVLPVQGLKKLRSMLAENHMLAVHGFVSMHSGVSGREGGHALVSCRVLAVGAGAWQNCLRRFQDALHV